MIVICKGLGGGGGGGQRKTKRKRTGEWCVNEGCVGGGGNAEGDYLVDMSS